MSLAFLGSESARRSDGNLGSGFRRGRDATADRAMQHFDRSTNLAEVLPLLKHDLQAESFPLISCLLGSDKNDASESELSLTS